MDASQNGRRRQALPLNLPPRMLSREGASEYAGVSPTTFDKGVEAGIFPKPVRVFARRLWDRRRLDAALDALDTSESTEDVWGEMAL